MQIHGIKLTKLHIHESAPFRRAIFNDTEILRGEKNNIHQPQKLCGLLQLSSVDSNPLCLIFAEMHVDFDLIPVLFQISPDVSLFLFEVNNIPILCSPVGFCRGTQINRLKDVRLPLCVVPVKNIRAFVEAHIQKSIIPEIG